MRERIINFSLYFQYKYEVFYPILPLQTFAMVPTKRAKFNNDCQ
jgi:hypothetical protein